MWYNGNMKAKIVSFVIAEVPKLKKGEAAEFKYTQSAPHYFQVSVPAQFILGEEKREILGKEVIFALKAYKPDVLLVEAKVNEIEDIFSQDAFNLREALIDGCHEIIKKHGGKFEGSEEYSLACVSEYKGDPDQFFNKKAQIASFLKSEKELLDEKEIEYTLSSQIKYSKDDLVILDWDGAFIFDPDGNFDAIIELFQLANLQLLRYRILGVDVDDRMDKISKLVRQKPITRFGFLKRGEITQSLREAITIRTQSVTEFEKLEREIKLIGDWYFARLYEVITKKFRMDEWKKSVKEKLDSLEDIYGVVSENFSMSRSQMLEFIQIIAFFILQIGWFALIILEFFYFTR